MSDNPAVAKVTTEEHGEIEVALDAVALPENYRVLAPGETPEGFVSRGDYNKDVATARKEAAKGLVNPATLLDDQDFRRRLYNHHGIEFEPETLAPIGKLPEDYQELRKQVNTLSSENKTLKGENAAYKAENEKSRYASHLSSLRVEMDHGETYVRRDKLESIFPGSQPAFLKECADQFTYSEDYGAYVFHDEDGEIVMDGARPAGYKAFLKRLKAHAGDRVFADRRQGGPDLSGDDGRPPRGAGKKTMLRSEFNTLSVPEQGALLRKGDTVVVDA